MAETIASLSWSDQEPPFIPGERRDWMGFKDFPKAKLIKVTDPLSLAYLQWSRENPLWEELFRAPDIKLDLPYKPKIVLLFGPSGAGKDIVAEEIIKGFGSHNVCHISTDDFYGPLGGEEEKKVLADNYDHPNAVDWKLLIKKTRQLQQGKLVFSPAYNFSNHSRYTDRRHVLMPAPIILISGIMIASQPELMNMADLVIGVEAPFDIYDSKKDVCVERRIRRDVEKRGRLEEHARQQIIETVYPGYIQFVLPYLNKVKALVGVEDTKIINLIVDNSQNAEEGFEPARLNREIYLAPLRRLLDRE